MANKPTTKEMEVMLSDTPKTQVYVPKEEKRFRVPVALVVFIFLLGIVCFITGIVLLAKSRCGDEDARVLVSKKPQTLAQKRAERCEYSTEAKKSGLDTFLEKVRRVYFELHPNNIAYDPDLHKLDTQQTRDKIRDLFRPYNPDPAMIKKKTDTAWKLLDEIKTSRVNLDNLKPRESKAFYQLKHFLQHVFGTAYDVNYYAGDFLLGPNFFCSQPICNLGNDLHNHLEYFAPTSLEDVAVLVKMLQQHVAVVDRYVENLKLGVKAGMVRSEEVCEAGLNSMKRQYLQVSLKGETGVLDEGYMKYMLNDKFYSNLTSDQLNQWKKDKGKTLNETLRDYAVEYIGKPINKLLRYLEDDHSHYCVPSDLASGLASLPLKHIFYDNKQTDNLTTRSLPDGSLLDGKKSYSMILSYFTTTDITPTKVHELGKKRLEVLYKQAVEVAKEVTDKANEFKAIAEFRVTLKDLKKSYFNDEKIPLNESDANAHKLCSSIEGAEKYCPKRWEALQKWFTMARKVMSMHDPSTVNQFYFTGNKHSTPTCPVSLVPDLNPSSGIQSYSSAGRECSKNSQYYIPFFLEDLGPSYSEYSINAHEARPGHHTQVQGSLENFGDECSDLPGWLNEWTNYGAFTEGWGLYAESPLIGEDTKTYDNNPMQKYGMLKWQIWRAIRLIVDTGLHFTDFTRKEALRYFDKKAWDNTDLAKKEVTRYQGFPGQATSYMIGQQHIVSLRKKAESKLGDKFILKDFHYQTLSQGSSPLGYLTYHIDKYIECTLDGTLTGCEYITGKDSIPLKRSDAEIVQKRPRKKLDSVRHYL